MKRALLLILLLMVPQLGLATTYTAATCSLADVLVQIALATADGDIVAIPAGTCTWAPVPASNPALTLGSVGITLQGAGVASTHIVDASTGNLISLVAVAGKAYRITGIDFERSQSVAASADSFAIVRIGGVTSELRIDNNRFDHCPGCTIPTVCTGKQLTPPKESIYFNEVNSAITGVITDNVFTISGGEISLHTMTGGAWGGGSYTKGDGAWIEDAQYGTDKFLFIENNVFDARCSGSSAPSISDSQAGARIVLRFNTIYNANGGAAHHGADSGGRRPPRALETYENDYVNTQSGSCLGQSQHRGGPLMAWNNTMQCYAGLWGVRYFRTGGKVNDYYPAADGSTHLDLNAGTIYAQGLATTGSSGVTLQVANAGWTPSTTAGTGWLGYSVKDCGAKKADWATLGPLTTAQLEDCHKGTIGYGSHVMSNDSDTIVLANVTTAVSLRPTFVTDDVFIILKVTKAFDNIGRGRGKYVSFGSIPSTCPGCTLDSSRWGHVWPEQVDEPSYVFNNFRCGSAPGCTLVVDNVWGGIAVAGTAGSVNAGPHAVADRDAFLGLTTAGDGSGGVGRGTKAQMDAITPTTVGVGFWVTDEGTWCDEAADSRCPSDAGGFNGQLYQAFYTDAPQDVATNPTDRGTGTVCCEWRLYYTPFPYPYSTEVAAAPVLSGLSPAFGKRTDLTRAMTFTGTGFNGGNFDIVISGCTGVTDSGIAGATDIERTATFTLSASAAGVCTVTVTTDAGTSAITQPFTVNQPIITSAEPPAGEQGSTPSITLNGTTLGGANDSVTVSGTGVTTANLTCPTALLCTVDFVVAADATPGTHTITYTSDDGTDATEFEVFDVVIIDKPVLTSIEPPVCYRGSVCPTSFKGINFTGATLIKSCSDSTMTMSSPVVVSDTLITSDITIPVNALLEPCDFQISTGGAPTLVGTSIDDTTSVAIDAHIANDLLVALVMRSSSAPPTIPSGWTEIHTTSSSGFWMGAYYQFAPGAGTLSGTWTGANIISVAVFRDQSSSAIGAHERATAISTTVTYPGVVFDITDGTSVAIGWGCALVGDATFGSTAPTGMTNRESIVLGARVCGVHTSAAVTGWDAKTTTVSSSVRNAGFIIEVKGEGSGNTLQIAPQRVPGATNPSRLILK